MLSYGLAARATDDGLGQLARIFDCYYFFASGSQSEIYFLICDHRLLLRSSNEQLHRLDLLSRICHLYRLGTLQMSLCRFHDSQKSLSCFATEGKCGLQCPTFDKFAIVKLLASYVVRLTSFKCNFLPSSVDWSSCCSARCAS